MSEWSQYGDGSYAVLSFEDPPLPQEPASEQELSEAVGVDATKEAAELAAALGLDLSQIQGSGKDGRVTKADVQAASA
jgi:2-oxoglutarate dehydrogenase E2 component (dihydrolipoamide succinyltransferase)